MYPGLVRVLTVGNMYPPHHLGGYELMWRSAVLHLREAGHDVRVLTTDYRAPGPERLELDDDVHRDLRWYWRDHRFPRLRPRERRRLEADNAAVLERHLDDVRPEVVNWWAMGGMSLSLIERTRRMGLPAAGAVVDDWMVYGPQVDAWLRAARRTGPLAPWLERRTGIPTSVDLGRAAAWLFVSETVRRRAVAAGWELPRSEIAHAGIDLTLFRPAAARPWQSRLLYLGRIDPRKGIDTAIRALEHLPDARLAVVGGGDEQHLEELRRLASRLGVTGRVSFERKRRDELPATYAEADAVLFPVRWEEPWGLVPLEAMAVGRPVVASGTGGSGEYLSDGANCLIYQPRDSAEDLARAVRRLAGDHELRGRLREGGLATAARFSETSFNAAVESSLERAIR